MTTTSLLTNSTHWGLHSILVSFCGNPWFSKMPTNYCTKGYIIWAYPHSWALQRFPVGKYLAANILLWALFLGLQCVCTNFGGLCE